MQWKPLSDRTHFILLSPLVVPVAVIATLVFLPLVVFGILLPEWVNHHFGPFGPTPYWKPWFAWYPIKVEINSFPTKKWVWLEQVERKAHWRDTVYRLPYLLTDEVK